MTDKQASTIAAPLWFILWVFLMTRGSQMDAWQGEVNGWGTHNLASWAYWSAA